MTAVWVAATGEWLLDDTALAYLRDASPTWSEVLARRDYDGATLVLSTREYAAPEPEIIALPPVTPANDGPTILPKIGFFSAKPLF